MAAKVDVDDLTSSFREMAVCKDDLNILLLGETGIGKSTFINSFTNYLHYDSLDIAEKNELKCLIPGKFEITLDKNGKMERHTISIGNNKDTNENTAIYTAATQHVRSYCFPLRDFNNKMVRIIDSPGICDDRGIEQDKTNLENILSYLGRLETLHGICILLRPNNARLTPALEYCITQLLSRLEKSAGDIIMFVFTNSRGSSYKPQDSSTAINALLTKIAKSPPHVQIKYEKENIFCLDNESFRYLAALKQNHDMGDKILMQQSWDMSKTECNRLIKYLMGEGPKKPNPHDVRRTISVNNARQVIMELSKPLVDITELINDNLTVLQTHQTFLIQEGMSIDDLNAKLYVPVMDLEQIECKKPKTICHNTKCCEKYSVGDITKWHYKQRCHDPCYLTNVTREVVGDSELKHCAAMDGTGKCKLCGCDFSAHMHIYYETRTVQGKIEGEGIRTQIDDMTTAMKQREKIIKQTEKEKNEYENEKTIIIKSMAKFAHFLERNAISPFNDSYKSYIKILIERENSRGPDCDIQQIQTLKSMLNQYDQEKKILEDALKVRVVGISNYDEITPDSIIKEIKGLYSLKKMGAKIKNMHAMQKRGEQAEQRNTEFVLPHSQGLSFNKSKNTYQAPRGKGSNKVNMIHEDNKFKKGGQEKQYRGKMQSMGRNYQKQQNNPNQNRNQSNQNRNQPNQNRNQSNQNRNQPNQNRNQSNQKEDLQRNNRSNPNNGGYNQHQLYNQQPNTPIPPLMAPNQFPPNFYQGPMNYPMQFPLNYSSPQQYQYPHPLSYQPNPQWNNYSPNQQSPNLYSNYPRYGFPPQQQAQNLQEHHQNIPMNNMDNSSSQQRKKDTLNDNYDSFYEELYSARDYQKTEKSNKIGSNLRDNKNMLNNEDSDSDNENASGYDKFRNKKGDENYAELYGDDDDEDNSRTNVKSGLFAGIKGLFK